MRVFSVACLGLLALTSSAANIFGGGLDKFVDPFGLADPILDTITKTIDQLDIGSMLDKLPIDEVIEKIPGLKEATKATLKAAADVRKDIGDNLVGPFNDFFKFIALYNKNYDDKSEVSNRFDVFMNSLKKIEEMGKNATGAVFGVTQFADETSDEFLKKFTGINNADTIAALNRTYSPMPEHKRHKREVPSNFDWRSRKVVTLPKYQGKCGCCYAFSSVGAIESLIAIKTGSLWDLSEQQVVSCATPNAKYHCQGCVSGTANGAFEYVIDNGGITDEANFPYQGETSTNVPYCPSGLAKRGTIKGWTMLTTDEEGLKSELYGKNPFVAHIDATNLQFYKGGVYDQPTPAGGWKINHGVIVIGYGVDGSTPFWTLKNSWSTQWGEKGFFRIRRGNNMLSVASFPFLPY